MDILKIDTEGKLLGSVRTLSNLQPRFITFKNHGIGHWKKASLKETIDLLDSLHMEINRRTRHLSTLGSAKLLPSEEFPWIVLVVDEWAEVAAGGSSKERALADELLRRYVSLGRAVGCTAILCTQRPTSEVIDVGTRTLLNERFALRCGDRHQAEAILSAGTFQPGDLIGASVGRALWSDGGPARSLQLFEVNDQLVQFCKCPAYRHFAIPPSKLESDIAKGLGKNGSN